METRKTKLGLDHSDTLTSMNNLASTYGNQHRWDEAEQLELAGPRKAVSHVKISVNEQAETDAPSELELTSGGFELYLPPTPFSRPPEPPRFVMLDDLNNVFYEVAYDFPHLKNKKTWTDLALHTTRDAAIVFTKEQWWCFEEHEQHRAVGNKDHEGMGAPGLLVSIESREGGQLTGTKIGAVNVRPFPPEFMNWDALGSLKAPELPAEMKAGLLRKVFTRRPRARGDFPTYVTPRKKLDGMTDPWHRDGAALNDKLNRRFAGGFRLPTSQKWKINNM